MESLKLNEQSATAMDLEVWGTIGSAIDGPMETRGKELWRSDDETVGTGIWEADAGRFRASFAKGGEFITVVSGTMTCTEENGPTTELGPGDSMTFPPGWTGEWQLHTPVRKLYCEFKPKS